MSETNTYKVDLVDWMGSDLSVVNAARVSFDKSSQWETVECHCGASCDEACKKRGVGCEFVKPVLAEKDKRLIRYLAEHDHWTPFAHTSITLRVSAPVPIRTQCFKHKQGFVENEESRRYISTEPELFIPDEFRMKPDGSIKQGSGESHRNSFMHRQRYEHFCRQSIELYKVMIEDDVCPEQARFVLPQGVMVNWMWTGSLFAYANFVRKRSAPTAQKEIAALASLVNEVLLPLFPVSWDALLNSKH